jgi:hypothetical protein
MQRPQTTAEQRHSMQRGESKAPHRRLLQHLEAKPEQWNLM